MIDRPTKMHDGIKIIGVIDKATDGCSVLLRAERTYCAIYDSGSCQCPFPYQLDRRGLWLPESEALALLLTGDVE